MSQGGGITWSGRAVRWLFWRAPKSAVQYTYRSNLALASDLGRRWIVFFVFGLWLWAFRWVTVQVVPPLRVVSAVLLLLWFVHGLNLVRWTIHARAGAARERALRREQYAMLQELRGDMRAAVTAGAGRVGEVFGMWGSARHHDPVQATLRQMEREQAEQVAQWLPPADEGFEPVFRVPRFLRRRRRKEPDDA